MGHRLTLPKRRTPATPEPESKAPKHTEPPAEVAAPADKPTVEQRPADDHWLFKSLGGKQHG